MKRRPRLGRIDLAFGDSRVCFELGCSVAVAVRYGCGVRPIVNPGRITPPISGWEG